jgi:hypothetical protein
MIFFDKLKNIIGDFKKEKNMLFKALLSLIAGVSLFFVIIFSLNSDIKSDVSSIIRNIENNKYSVAIEQYKNIEKNYSQSKLKKFDELFSNKLQTIIIERGEDFIDGKMSKEDFLNLINTINLFDNTTINFEKVLYQVERVSDIYMNDNVDYDTAISYINTVSILKNISESSYKYKQIVELCNESRKVYANAVELQKENKYADAITEFDKVLEIDKKTYKSSQEEKKKCIEKMYDYYIEKSKQLNDTGDYERALEYINYLQKYYKDDVKIQELKKQVNTNLVLNSLSDSEILNIISEKSKISKEDLSISSSVQNVGEKKYYYVEVYIDSKLKNEILIDPKTKEIFSYRDSNRSYSANYVNGYFKADAEGNVVFSVEEYKAIKIIEDALKSNEISFKKVTKIDLKEAKKYISKDIDVGDILGDDADIYYTYLVSRGLFRKKQIYFIDMYTKKVYSIENGKMKCM